MAKRQVFFSFEYVKDNWRASQVRNMGKVDSSSTFSDNDWEEVKCKTDTEIKKWIDSQMSPSKNPLKNLNPSAKYAIIELKEEGNKNAVQLF